ncbi:hypothetical protein GLOTRDRAFT_130499 [Gloeophyllum trabeum ATCC 11539]|uniref:Uncharacterized protein n=1 Tax=Gloeophyllum trabeum (strain ATCC 11539 / FP-39264 / Madison 617) TaxID=670483 RepID=S7Q3U5_GLOTA|nr:uncharacterized protein GLOTRDRAFT_130499 [Gloeophyllum trabeum ATCC 11539]EPQ54113.1 hypothetical protein GLOTRDRAFT_130499 [Gloeophyllum trabeum ATCC 11539]
MAHHPKLTLEKAQKKLRIEENTSIQLGEDVISGGESNQPDFEPCADGSIPEDMSDPISPDDAEPQVLGHGQRKKQPTWKILDRLPQAPAPLPPPEPSIEELDKLVANVIQAPDFSKSDFSGFDAKRETAKLDAALSDPAHVKDGWHKSVVEIPVPDGDMH